MALNRLGSSLGILLFRSCQLRIPDGESEWGAGQAASKQCSSLSKTSSGGKGPRFFLIILQTSDTNRHYGHSGRSFSIRGFLYQQKSTSKFDSLIMFVRACASMCVRVYIYARVCPGGVSIRFTLLVPLLTTGAGGATGTPMLLR